MKWWKECVGYWLKKLTVSSPRKAEASEFTEELALTDSETLDEVIECLVENFSIETQGICDQQTLFKILIKAASGGDRVNASKLLFITTKVKNQRKNQDFAFDYFLSPKAMSTTGYAYA